MSPSRRATGLRSSTFESADHRQLKGNIYLARVVRVEPSLQAAFVEFGGNRHGFLAFSEIHPDYYQIPRADREALLAEEAEHAAEAARLEDEHAEAETDDVEDDTGEEDAGEDEAPPEPDTKHAAHDDEDGKTVAALRSRRESVRRRYRIQDVIKRRQVMLVQVVKEERGNKGAALTTYLSLAGRYTVLMPNTSKGGGISRKISSAADRKRLKSIMAEFDLPRSMGLIVRTAGLQRTRAEIKRDFDYLARLWDGIREATLRANAPELIYADSDLLKRAIRDIYNKDVDEVLVEGPEGYTQAKEFMKLLMPSHARRVKHYADPVPLFQREGVEDQLSAMFSPTVQLKSGGYLVINPTEALVSIDINSGRSTREHGIEATALKTNLEAAEEIARQLRLRDMAGLVVIDFIDMESNSNNKKVERCLKDALKDDRARIQVGRISSFGLLEMSRQRLRTGVLEASTHQCPHCEGTGLMRTAASSGLSALRMLEEEAARGRGSQLTLRAGLEAAFYVLNSKRDDLMEVENRYGVSITVEGDATLEGARMEVDASGPPPVARREQAPVIVEDEDEDIPEEEIDAEEAAEIAAAARERQTEDEEGKDRSERGGGRRRRRRRGGARDDRASDDRAPETADTTDGEEDDHEEDTVAVRDESGDEDGESRRRRRGRRGGRRRRTRDDEVTGASGTGGVTDGEGEADETASPPSLSAQAAEADAPEMLEPGEPAGVAEEPKPTRRRRSKKADTAEAAAPEDSGEDEAPAKPRRRRTKAAEADQEAVSPEGDSSGAATPVGDETPKRRTRARKPKEAVAAEAEDASADAAPPAVAEPADTAPAPATIAADEAANDAAETVLEAAGADVGGDTAPSGPPRKGWWQRTFG